MDLFGKNQVTASKTILITSASVPGTEHTLPGRPMWRNNQDAYVYERVDNWVVGVLCDGCGAGMHSELGAQIISRLVATTIVKFIQKRNGIHGFRFEILHSSLVNRVSELANGMGLNFINTIREYFLCTIVGFIAGPEKILAFHIGDGVLVVNEEVFSFGPFPENTPPYLLYTATGSTIFDHHRDLLEFQVQEFDRCNVTHILIASDGILDLMSASEKCLPGKDSRVGDWRVIFQDELFFKNPDYLRRYLAKMNCEAVVEGRLVSGILPDDTTIIAVKFE